MPNYRRAVQPGGTFFFTVVTFDRQPILKSAETLAMPMHGDNTGIASAGKHNVRSCRLCFEWVHTASFSSRTRTMSRLTFMSNATMLMRSSGFNPFGWRGRVNLMHTNSANWLNWFASTKQFSWSDGMGTSTIKIQPLATQIAFTADTLKVTLADGREVSAPLAWFPRLLDASDSQRSAWRLIGRGVGIHWSEVDEDISVEQLMAI